MFYAFCLKLSYSIDYNLPRRIHRWHKHAPQGVYMIVHEQPFKSTRKHAPERQINDLGRIFCNLFSLPECSLKWGLRFKASVCLSGAFCFTPFKVSRPYIQAARRPSRRVWRGFMIHYSGLTKPAFRARLSTHPENRPFLRSFSADFPIIFGFYYGNIKRPAPCAFLRQSAGLYVIVGES